MQNNPEKIITTSWDDGHPLDKRIAELLIKYRLKGTFYVSAFNPEHEVMQISDIKELSKYFEIGGHTKNHVVLTKVPLQVASNEISECKAWLSDMIGKPPVCFCYPQGKFTASIVKLVQEDGFKYARTTEYSRIDIRNILIAPTTMQMYKHTKGTYLKNLVKRGNIDGMEMVFKIRHYTPRLIDLIEYWLEKINREGGIFHLWGHSWEIDQFDLWGEIEEVLKLLSHLDGFAYKSNGELLNDGK